jgi:hypothetical protein
MSGTRHFKPGVGAPSEDVAIEGRELPSDVLWLFRRMGAASLGCWHFCSFQDSVSTRNVMISVRDDVGLDVVDEACVSRQITQPDAGEALRRQPNLPGRRRPASLLDNSRNHDAP